MADAKCHSSASEYVLPLTLMKQCGYYIYRMLQHLKCMHFPRRVVVVVVVVCVCVCVLETRLCVQKAKCILTHNRITYFRNMNLKPLNSQQS